MKTFRAKIKENLKVVTSLVAKSDKVLQLRLCIP